MSLIDYSCHGGSCCGVKHIYDFPADLSKTQRKSDLLHALACVEDDNEDCEEGSWEDLAIEMTLASYQMGWLNMFKEMDIQPIYTFVNPNTTNKVNVYLILAGELLTKVKNYQP